jgi:hypothetical protein
MTYFFSQITQKVEDRKGKKLLALDKKIYKSGNSEAVAPTCSAYNSIQSYDTNLKT